MFSVLNNNDGESFFSDINECLDPNLNKCDKNAKCSDIDQSYECECKNGFRGNGKLRELLECESTRFLQLLLTILFLQLYTLKSRNFLMFTSVIIFFQHRCFFHFGYIESLFFFFESLKLDATSYLPGTVYSNITTSTEISLPWPMSTYIQTIYNFLPIPFKISMNVLKEVHATRTLTAKTHKDRIPVLVELVSRVMGNHAKVRLFV